ncbi:MAG: hypothetical protein JWM10_4620 [Myxococcaceae bacterium]|nr:hypothetical protein [Myxococcaceae bacterium]
MAERRGGCVGPDPLRLPERPAYETRAPASVDEDSGRGSLASIRAAVGAPGHVAGVGVSAAPGGGDAGASPGREVLPAATLESVEARRRSRWGARDGRASERKRQRLRAPRTGVVRVSARCVRARWRRVGRGGRARVRVREPVAAAHRREEISARPGRRSGGFGRRLTAGEGDQHQTGQPRSVVSHESLRSLRLPRMACGHDPRGATAMPTAGASDCGKNPALSTPRTCASVSLDRGRDARRRGRRSVVQSRPPRPRHPPMVEQTPGRRRVISGAGRADLRPTSGTRGAGRSARPGGIVARGTSIRTVRFGAPTSPRSTARTP